MRMYDTERGITVLIDRDYEMLSEDTEVGDAVAVGLVGAFVVFLVLML